MKKINIKYVCALLICLLSCIFIIACGTKKNIKNEANNICTAFESNDIKEIEKIIMGTTQIKQDEELSEFFGDETNETKNGNGIIYEIIKNSSIKVKKIKQNYICYEIESPELDTIFQDVYKNDDIKNLKEDLKEYIDNANRSKKEVTINYRYDNNIFNADYQNKEFVNAILGNCTVSYQNMINDIFK
jgi:hypothetical protein